jgi:hypothetical protein
VLMCFQSRDPSISLEPAVQGPVEGSVEAARDGVEDAARVVARGSSMSLRTHRPSAWLPLFLLFLFIPIINVVRLFVDLDLTSVVVILFSGSWHRKDLKKFHRNSSLHFSVMLPCS